MQKKLQTKTLPQVIVTGQNTTVTEAAEVRTWCLNKNFFIGVEWCHTDGGIGYMDMANSVLTHSQLLTELKQLAQTFPKLDVGVSLMSGPPGSYNYPVIGYRVKDGKVVKEGMPHLGHQPPTRGKKK